MKFSELLPEQIAKIRQYSYDQIVEKHEGPWSWASTIGYLEPEFFEVAGSFVLLPVERKNHPQMRVVRSIPSADGQVLTVFLQDTTYYGGIDSGFLAVCERVPGEPWFIATVYHEWFLRDYTGAEDGASPSP